MESYSKPIYKISRHHVTHTLETRGTLHYNNMLRFAYNRHCLDVHSNDQFYAELWIESNMDVFCHLEYKNLKENS